MRKFAEIVEGWCLRARNIMSMKEHINNEGVCRQEVFVDIYVAEHCFVCDYSYEIAEMIKRDFPQVHVRIVNLSNTREQVPDSVFATPTYLLNGQVWSLGNPSPQQVTEKLQSLLVAEP